MGHHINTQGQFQSDKHPELPADRVRINFVNPRSWRALFVLAESYRDVDPEFADDVLERLRSLGALADNTVHCSADHRQTKVVLVLDEEVFRGGFEKRMTEGGWRGRHPGGWEDRDDEVSDWSLHSALDGLEDALVELAREL